ncbi:MAG: radical SAM protein [Marinilabiliaceae bacterium]|nr:radical SAM protein [Marinilabiliaceae bacterium]
MKYEHLFGPVPSRRLGMSLGIDLVPKKVCSLDCVYCEVGQTTLHTTIRKEYILFDKIAEELKHYLNNNAKPDFLTLTGSGEPTLNSRIGDLISFIKQNYSEIPVAVITNGTLLNNPKVREEILHADVVLPSLDASKDEIFKKINSPCSSLTVKDHVEGLVKFRESYTGKMWLEVFILPGYNDSVEEISRLKEMIEAISPDAVQLNTLDRPGVIEDLYPASHEELIQIATHLTSQNIEIIVNPPKKHNLTIDERDLDSVILSTLQRRPCTLDDLTKITGLNEVVLSKYMVALLENDIIEPFQQKRGKFYRIKGIE